MSFPFELNLSPDRRQVLSLALQQALEILQMPQADLAQWIEAEVEKNPLLELGDSHRKRGNCIQEELIASEPTLYEYLNQQIRETFLSPKERFIAEKLLEQLDEKGFFSASTDSLATLFQWPLSQVESILATLKTFEPAGIFARNLQESLLLQLKAKNQENSKAYLLIRDCFEDLLHSRYTPIKKKLGNDVFPNALQKIARLHFRPAALFERTPSPSIHPDFEIVKGEAGWEVHLLEEAIPSLRSDYLEIPVNSDEEKESMRAFSISAKWLLRSLSRRQKLLLDLVRYLAKKQALYLDQQGPLAILSFKEIATELQIHESTLSRALSGKYALTPRGLILLRSLIASFPATDTAKEILEKLIAQEDQAQPLTDQQLAEKLKTQGLIVSRRTIAKYRSQLKIGSASCRKHALRI